MAARKNWKLIVRKFIAVLRKEIRLDRVVVFGSYIHGKPKPYSDIDVAIFSPDFKDRNEIRNMQYLMKHSMKVDTLLEPHPYHSRDLKKPEKGTLLYEILKTGVRLL